MHRRTQECGTPPSKASRAREYSSEPLLLPSMADSIPAPTLPADLSNEDDRVSHYPPHGILALLRRSLLSPTALLPQPPSSPMFGSTSRPSLPPHAARPPLFRAGGGKDDAGSFSVECLSLRRRWPESFHETPPLDSCAAPATTMVPSPTIRVAVVRGAIFASGTHSLRSSDREESLPGLRL